MKVVINLPTDNNKTILEENVATFRATLILESIKQLQLDNDSKKRILSSILEKYKKES